MLFPLARLGRLQRKVLMVISIIVVVPMLVAGWLASEWVTTQFEHRIERWIVDAARSNQNWLQAYQNDALMLGRVLADDRKFRASLSADAEAAIPPAVRRIAQELGIHLLQIYTPQQDLVYSSLPLKMHGLWELGQSEAVLKVERKDKNMLAAIGITPIPRRGTPRRYLVLGSLLGEDFTKELAQLTGLTTRLYYREGRGYYDLLSTPGQVFTLEHLPAEILARIEKDKRPHYALAAERGEFRGLYTPIVDSTGRVEAIMFSGLERRGFHEVLTNRIALFVAISALGIVIGALTGLFLSRMVVRPLRELRHAAMQLAGQNFNAAVPVTSDDEFGDLGRAFNSMAQSMREARDEQAQRFRTDKLAAMGELSAALAHEIRNPVGVISTSAALLEKPDLDDAKQAQLLQMIREESGRVSTLVQDFLQLSRHRRPLFTSIDPVEPMERALKLALAGQPDIEVHRDFRHAGACILADPALLQQAWGNLLTNAMQAMNGGDKRIYLGTDRHDGQLTLSIEDNGPGVPAEIMPRLFEPFFTTKDQGTGLGLSIAYSLVEANGGRLEALPPGRSGARFVMRFPIHQTSGARSEQGSRKT